MELGLEMYALLFGVALLAGFIDAIAGGGGLITIPALLATGMPPALALGTNKLQACGGSFSASWYFIRRKAVNLREIAVLIGMTFLGAVLGTVLVQQMNADFLKKILPFLIFAIGIYFLLTPKLGESDKQKRVSYLVFAVTAGFAIGFYDGFFGPGTGSFLSLAFVMLLGFNLAKATAHAKVLNFTSNIASLLFFLIGGQVAWTLGLVMLAGQFIGARMGARMVLTKGQKLIRPMVVVVAFVMASKLAFDYGWFG
ncbi:TSUP family transporter [Testudinibacter sp. P80/BLE/0925]|uniref:TSUP family transporter n=1 Tax=Testudinibacter sp. TW-1 TaxID=3417757 RepID=UPI003D35A093